MGYDSINQVVLREVPENAKAILDLGCGGGALGQLLKRRGTVVVGVTSDEEEAVVARPRLDKVVVSNLNTLEPRTLGRFDCVVCCHVLEHLLRPEVLVAQIRDCIAPGGSLVVALPNVLFWKQRLQFLRGRFRYSDGGLMDRTHYRFYDWQTAQELLIGSGYRIMKKEADGGFPLSRILCGGPRRVVNHYSLKWFPGLFGWQFVFRCVPR
jgi:SAM-dependent methyltransferase